MAESTRGAVVQLYYEWEIQLVILLSFALQLFLFFFGGLRRRSSSWLLGLLLWLAYLSADAVAIYALGHLSSRLPSTSDMERSSQAEAVSNQAQQVTFMWAPFLLVHLGGPDTMTAFALEDNELWLRHLLTLLVQLGLVLYVIWWSLLHDRLLAPALLVLAAGIIKYGERIWALKSGSQKAIRNPQYGVAARKRLRLGAEAGDSLEPTFPATQPSTYQTIIRHALHSQAAVRHVFGGRNFSGMDAVARPIFESRDLREEALFKRAEVQLSLMYDDLFTKGNVMQTSLGTVLRCVSLACTVVAFLLFIVLSRSSKQGYNFTSVDATITYVLFTGALCLEACASFVVMMSPWTWGIWEARGRRRSRIRKLVSRVLWFILVRTQPETRQCWSNSMGQYNLLSSLMADKNPSMVSNVTGKLMGLVGASELWKSVRHTRHAQVTMKIKEIVSDSNYLFIHFLIPPIRVAARLPFEVNLLAMHIFTHVFLSKTKKEGTSADISQEGRDCMDACEEISNYMMYLLVAHPALLPVEGDVQEMLGKFQERLDHESSGGVEEDLLARSEMCFDEKHRETVLRLFEYIQVELRERDQRGVVAQLLMLRRMWIHLLVYAAGKSRPVEHARRLATGGELLTFLWLLMASRGKGDQGKKYALTRD